MMTNEDILAVFSETEGIQHGHFQLASGRHSDTYMQCAKLFLYPDKSETLCKELAARLKDFTIETVASPAIGGIIMGYEMARQLKVPNIFVERIEGKMTLRRGFSVKPGEKILVVEDVVTTGGSVAEVAELLESLGAEVVAIASIVDRSNGKVDFKRPYRALLTQDVVSYEADVCPLCRAGVPITKPGTKAIQK